MIKDINDLVFNMYFSVGSVVEIDVEDAVNLIEGVEVWWCCIDVFEDE